MESPGKAFTFKPHYLSSNTDRLGDDAVWYCVCLTVKLP